MTRGGELHVTREQVCEAVSSEHTWEIAAQTLGVSPGLAFMVATGIPADGSGVPELGERTGDGPSLSSPQYLVNPRGHNPLRSDLVDAWVRERAGRELGRAGSEPSGAGSEPSGAGSEPSGAGSEPNG